MHSSFWHHFYCTNNKVGRGLFSKNKSAQNVNFRIGKRKLSSQTQYCTEMRNLSLRYSISFRNFQERRQTRTCDAPCLFQICGSVGSDCAKRSDRPGLNDPMNWKKFARSPRKREVLIYPSATSADLGLLNRSEILCCVDGIWTLHHDLRCIGDADGFYM